MKNLFLLIVVLGMSFNVYAQSNLASYGIFNDKNIIAAPKKPINNSTKSRSHSPIVIHTIPSPTSQPIDIAFDGVNLWVEGSDDFLLYKISPVDGSIIKTIPTTLSQPDGLEFENGNLLVTDALHHYIQRVDTSDGNEISSFPTPSTSVSSFPAGLAWDGQHLWLNDPMSTWWNPNDSTYKLSTNGQIIQSYHAFGTFTTGLAWDGQYLWSSDNASFEIYKIDVSSFTVVDTINAPGGWFPNGLAYDGQYLWVANNDADSLYQIDIGNSSNGLPNNTLLKSLDFILYPNPAQDEITIKLLNNKVGLTYSITDQIGRRIVTGKIHDNVTIIDIHQLASGTYLFNFGEISKQSFKILKK
jgi:hypothetical protein